MLFFCISLPFCQRGSGMPMEVDRPWRGKLNFPSKQASKQASRLSDVVRWLSLEECIISLNTGLNPRKFFRLNTDDAKNYYITIQEIHDGNIIPNEKTDRINDEALALCNHRSNLEKGDVLFSGTGTIGETAIVKETPTNWNIKEGVYTIKPNPQILSSRYLRYLLESSPIKKVYMTKAVGGTVKSVPMKELRKIKIPVPSMEAQERISSLVEKFDLLRADMTAGLPAEIEARKKQYAYYRDRLLDFREKRA